MAAAAPTYGFLGLGIMGEAMAKRLLLVPDARVVVWNRSAAKCEALVAAGGGRVSHAATPAAVVAQCAVTFAMLSDPAAAEEVALGAHGVVEGLLPGHSFVDMSTVDAATSTKIATAVAAKGGRFLEAPVSGSKQPAIDGQLVILAAGDESLYAEVAPAFAVLGKKSFYLGEAGKGAQMKLVVNMMMGSMMASLSEGVSLAGAAGLQPADLLSVLELGAIAAPMFKMKGPLLAKGGPYPPAFPLKHQQKDLRLALELGAACAVPLPVAAAANEMFVRAVGEGHGDEDFSAVHAAAKRA